MIFTASDIESLSRSLSRWEWAEYGSEAFVIIACAGEFVADLERPWLTEERKHHLQRRSTILLVAALFASLVCLIRTNELSGSVIGFLGQRAEEAGVKAQKAIADSGDAAIKAGTAQDISGRAIDKSSKADTAASNALTVARSGQRKAEQLRVDLGKATAEAVALQKYVDEVARREYPRELNGRNFVKSLEGKPRARVELLYDPNTADAWSFARDIYWWLGKGIGNDKGAGWEVSSPKPIPPDAKLQENPSLADTPPAMRFSGAFTRFGLTIRSRWVDTPSNVPMPSALACEINPSRICFFWAGDMLIAAIVGNVLPDARGGDVMIEPDESLPDDMIVVVVGPKPPIWLGIKNLKPPRKQ